MSFERQQASIEKQIAEVEEGIAELRASGAERFTVKSMERTKRGLKSRLANHSPRKQSWRRKASGWQNSTRFWTWTEKRTILSVTAKTEMTQTGLLCWMIFTAASRKCHPIGGQNPVNWRNGHEGKRSDASLPCEQRERSMRNAPLTGSAFARILIPS